VFTSIIRQRLTITLTTLNKAKQALPTGQEKTRAQKHQSKTWAQKRKRFFGIEIETCEQGGGANKIKMSIADPIGELTVTQSPEYKK
jgi:hypothetical protein